MRVNEAGTEFDELSLHCIINTSRESIIVRAGALEGSLLLEVVETYIICIMCATTAQINVVVLADTSLKHLIKPIGIGVILKLIGCTAATVTTRKGCTRVGTCLTQIRAVLIGIHYIVDTLANNIYTEVALVV